MRRLMPLLFPILLGCSNSQEFTWDFINRKIQHDFPNAPEMKADELNARISEGKALYLFDVRAPSEYAVSQIKNAENLESAEAIAGAVPDKGAPIIAYCSVGYRSGKVVEELRSMGYTNVYNLRGSIFGWANEGKPVYKGESETAFVHPFDEAWGVLLDRKLHRYEPAE